MAEFSRRDFLRSASVVGAAAAAASLVGCKKEEPAPVAPVDPVSWAEEADVVIIGCGFAGMAAAKLAAIDNNQKVIIIEKAPENRAGGSSRTNGAFFMMLPDGHYISNSFGAIQKDLIDRMREHFMDIDAWVKGPCGVTVGPDMCIVGYGEACWDGMHNELKKCGNIVWHYGERATKIIQGDDGEVHGVEATGEGGAKKNYKAKRGVIMCTGTYASNQKLVWGTHFPYLPYASCTSPYNEGDGIFLAAKAGGAVLQDVSLAYDFFGWAMRKASEEVGSAVIQEDFNWKVNKWPHARVFVNRDGKRFMAEDVVTVHGRTTYPFMFWDDKANATKGYPNMPMWGVYDQRILDSGCLWHNDKWTWARTFDLAEWSQDNMKEVEKGWILKADTLDELAAKMVSTDPVTGEKVVVNAEGLKATIDEYNKNCEAGIDPLGKETESLKGIYGPPYYAIELEPSIGYTTNGVSADNNSQVLDWDDKPIPRFYCAGDVAQRMRLEPILMSGVMARGMIAAEEVGNLQPWDE